MTLRNNVLFSFCFLIAVVKCFNVSEVRAPPPRPDKKPKSFMKTGDDDSEEKDLVASLDEFMHIAPQPFNTVSAPYVFEGVDYDLLKNLSAKTYEDYYDCSYWWTRCIRDTTQFHMVCVYHYSWTWVNFVNLCHMELENCKHRTAELWWKINQGVYGERGENWWDFVYNRWYIGDGWNCRHAFRRNVPNDQVNFYYEDEQQPLIE